MVNNILGKCNDLEVLYRLDVNFNIEETSLDSMIGRTAHILFLENEDLMKKTLSLIDDIKGLVKVDEWEIKFYKRPAIQVKAEEIKEWLKNHR